MDFHYSDHPIIFKVITTITISTIFLFLSQFIIQITTYNDFKNTITWKLQTISCFLYSISLLISIIKLRRQKINYNLYIHCESLLLFTYLIIDRSNNTILDIIVTYWVFSVSLCIILFYLFLSLISIRKMKLCDKCYNV